MERITSEIIERPILFSGPMVRAILDDRKTMTRRVMKPQPTYDPEAWKNYHPIGGNQDGAWVWSPRNNCFWFCWDDWSGFDPRIANDCPYGRPANFDGDRLWVRETWWGWGHFEETGNLTESGEPEMKFIWDEDYESLAYVLDCPVGPDYEPDKMTPDSRDKWHKRPSIFMPRWASRLILEITGVKVERVQDISEEDAIAEGIERDKHHGYWLPGYNTTPVFSFRELWNSINDKHPGCSWSDNPWVWVVEFKRVDTRA